MSHEMPWWICKIVAFSSWFRLHSKVSQETYCLAWRNWLVMKSRPLNIPNWSIIQSVFPRPYFSPFGLYMWYTAASIVSNVVLTCRMPKQNRRRNYPSRYISIQLKCALETRFVLKKQPGVVSLVKFQFTKDHKTHDLSCTLVRM